MKVNDQITCKVTGIQPYGIFVSYEGYVGLIHISEISDQFVQSLETFTNVGDQIRTVILAIDEGNKRLKLSYKKANPVHPRIQKIVKIKIGFHSLSKALPFWIEKSKK
jgi:general stress protein 13